MEQNFPGLLKSLEQVPRPKKIRVTRPGTQIEPLDMNSREKIPIEIEQITPPARSPPPHHQDATLPQS